MVDEDVDDAMGLAHGLLGMASRRRTRRRTFAKRSLSDTSAARASAIGGMAPSWQHGAFQGRPAIADDHPVAAADEAQ
jgi:hypothetical protein